MGHECNASLEGQPLLKLEPSGCSGMMCFVDFEHHVLLSLTLLIVDPQRNKKRETREKRLVLSLDGLRQHVQM